MTTDASNLVKQIRIHLSTIGLSDCIVALNQTKKGTPAVYNLNRLREYYKKMALPPRDMTDKEYKELETMFNEQTRKRQKIA